MAAALAVEFGKAGFFRSGASMEFLTEQARMMLHDVLAALDGWTLVPTPDWELIPKIALSQEAEIARLRAALAEIVAMERYVTSPTRLDLMVTLGRALDVAKGALGLLEPLAALAPSEP
jgi:ATP phosphoribosyltransferase regulatory subunit HisZ